MTSSEDGLEIGRRWCMARGPGWHLVDTAGRGGTAPVFTIKSPEGEYALKILDEVFSSGERGEESLRRIEKQLVDLGQHDCPFLVKIFDGGRFEDRLFLLMNKVPGQELEKCLASVPRELIGQIVDQIARAAIYLRDRRLCHRDIKSANVIVSSDYRHATLLDLSVTRDIEDPIGLGTDHDGQLPVVATSRYSPPEYLFRLVEPSPSLWHALDVYQLGGLLHDLIMQVPMFEDDYRLSSTNRYRFAWIVATQTPPLDSADVEPRLITLARRALDKDWKRRSDLRLDDFLTDATGRQRLAMEALGLGGGGPKTQSITINETRQTLQQFAESAKENVRAFFMSKGVLVTHENSPGAHDLERVLTFRWQNEGHYASPEMAEIVLRYVISARHAIDGATIDVIAQLSADNHDSNVRPARIALPTESCEAASLDRLSASMAASIGVLADQMFSNR